MSDSEGSTIALSPGPFAEEIANPDNEDDVFAWLRPHSETACAAFNASVNSIIKFPEKYTHARHFFHVSGRGFRASSVYTEDDAASGSGLPQWLGAFKLSLKVPPNDPASGWCLGTNRGRPLQEIDILLAPPMKKWSSTRIAGKHARLFFHHESYRMMLEGRHTVTTTRNGAAVITQSRSRVIEHGELIEIGNCLYIFEYTEAHSTPTFEQDLSQFMKKHESPQWLMNKFLTPNSVGVPLSLGSYYSSASAFAQGTFGKISAGWAQDGNAVAIKVFKDPRQSEITMHQQLMKDIGYHPNIVQLLKCVCHFDTDVPDAYCIYSPLAAASLTSLFGAYKIELSANINLLVDYLQGLKFLHEKGIMHRDINPNNLAVTSFAEPRGLIIDLDAATQHETSCDHMQGTKAYLAPEIIDLKEHRGLVGYGRSVDIWALGLSMFAAHTGGHFRWSYFNPLGRQPSNSSVVDRELHAEFHKNVSQSMESAQDIRLARFLELIRDMTTFAAARRYPTSKALDAATEIKGKDSKGTITLRSAHKRRRED